MDFSSFPAFEAARSVAGDERENRVAASLQLRKAEHESNVLGPALGGSLVLLGAAWFAHAFWPMLAVVGFRFVTDLGTQYNSRAIIVSLAANEDPRELTRRSHIKYFTTDDSIITSDCLTPSLAYFFFRL